MDTEQLNRLVAVLAPVTLFEMMVAIGLGVAADDVARVGKNWRLLIKAGIANYVCVPAAAVGLLLLFQTNPYVAVGFLIIAICPGAPFGPPLTAIAKGNVATAVGLMVALAGSSAIVTPLLLGVLLDVVLPHLPALTEDEFDLSVDAGRMAATLLLVQFVPLGIGLALRQWRPAWAELLSRPSNRLSMVLNLTLFALIVWVQRDMLLNIPVRGYFGMSLLVAASALAGYVLSTSENHRAMVMATSVRNVGVCLVVVTAAFPGTRAVAAVAVFALFQTLVMALAAGIWGRLPSDTANPSTAADVGASGDADP